MRTLKLFFALGGWLALLFYMMSRPPVNLARNGNLPEVKDITSEIESWRNKTILVFSPHPDDELKCYGTMAKLIENGNKVKIVMYTTGNKGSRDTSMSSERLARIRKAEAEKADGLIGIKPEDFIWLGYDDGELEYVDRWCLTRQVCRIIRENRPDAVFSYDPGKKWEQWHKTDHRSAAFITVDAARAAGYWLYFPNDLKVDGIQPYEINLFYFYGSYEPNVRVNIGEYAETKIRACYTHVSQFGKRNFKYAPTLAPEDQKKMEEKIKNLKPGDRFEYFRQEGSLTF